MTTDDTNDEVREMRKATFDVVDERSRSVIDSVTREIQANLQKLRAARAQDNGHVAPVRSARQEFLDRRYSKRGASNG
jgi:hypothetical protein